MRPWRDVEAIPAQEELVIQVRAVAYIQGLVEDCTRDLVAGCTLAPVEAYTQAPVGECTPGPVGGYIQALGVDPGPGGGIYDGPPTPDGYKGPWSPCITGVLGDKWTRENCPQY